MYNKTDSTLISYNTIHHVINISITPSKILSANYGFVYNDSFDFEGTNFKLKTYVKWFLPNLLLY